MSHAAPFALCAVLLAAGAAQANALGENVPRPLLPRALHGLYAVDLAACRNRNSDSRIAISAREIRFHESTALPDRLIELPGGAVAIWADVEGEGEGWNELLAIAPSEGGTRLARYTANDGHAGQSRIDYVRCPGPGK